LVAVASVRIPERHADLSAPSRLNPRLRSDALQESGFVVRSLFAQQGWIALQNASMNASSWDVGCQGPLVLEPAAASLELHPADEITTAKNEKDARLGRMASLDEEHRR
jgi:hypothetical protein